jgi:hypothetical protein
MPFNLACRRYGTVAPSKIGIANIAVMFEPPANRTAVR